jgi:hypothetical protein
MPRAASKTAAGPIRSSTTPPTSLFPDMAQLDGGGMVSAVFELLFRFFLPVVADRLQIRSALMLASEARLRAAGIPVAVPQRDVRLRAEAPAPPPGPSG